MLVTVDVYSNSEEPPSKANQTVCSAYILIAELASFAFFFFVRHVFLHFSELDFGFFVVVGTETREVFFGFFFPGQRWRWGFVCWWWLFSMTMLTVTVVWCDVDELACWCGLLFLEGTEVEGRKEDWLEWSGVEKRVWLP